MKGHGTPAVFFLIPLFTVLALILNTALGIPVVSVAFYVMGPLFHTLLVNIRLHSHTAIEPAVSGETAIAVVSAILMLRFLNNGLISAFSVIAAALLLFSLTASFLLGGKKGEHITFGMLTSSISAAAFLFLLFSDTGDTKDISAAVMSGLIHFTESGINEMIFIYSAFILAAIVIVFAKPEIRLLLQGKDYFALSGINPSVAAFSVMLARSLLYSATLICCGVFSAPVIMLAESRFYSGRSWAMVFPAILYTQLLAGAWTKTGSLSIPGFALALPLLVQAASYRNRRVTAP